VGGILKLKNGLCARNRSYWLWGAAVVRLLPRLESFCNRTENKLQDLQQRCLGIHSRSAAVNNGN
ncbi:hypothetical protein HAX54_040478, partial [Datura stramonium]|nr:hypothetical protein [Datura stramonium]